jgi:hypothetical protein
MREDSVLGAEPIYLGLGLYTGSSSWIRSVLAREVFLDALIRIEPRTLHSLTSTIGIALAFDALDDESLPEYVAQPRERSHEMAIVRRSGVLHGYLQAWKRHWHIPDPWIDVLAADTLLAVGLCRQLSITPPVRFVTFPASHMLEAKRIAARHTSTPAFTELPRLVGQDADGNPADVWDPFMEPRAVAKQRLMSVFETELDHLLDRIEEPWRSDRYEPTVVKRHPEHFDWVVHYQVLGKSYGTIQRTLAPATSRQGISKAIRDTAALVGLTLRQPNRAGAPKKQPTTDRTDSRTRARER